MGKNANFVSHKKSKQIVDGKPKLPLAVDLVEGEIAINFGKDVETLSIKNESGDVVTFSSDNYYNEKKLGSGFTGENSAVTVTDTILWESGTGLNSVVLKGSSSTASGNYSVAEGQGTVASGNYSHAEGQSTTASGNYSHAEGYSTSAMSQYSHAEGRNTFTTGYGDEHAEGNSTSGIVCSHAEGYGTYAVSYSHAEGYGTFVTNYSHAEGYYTSGISYSHAEGYQTNANNYSHAEGYQTNANNYSHAEGNHTTASGQYSHAEGNNTQAKNYSEHASGQYNVSSSASTTFGDSGNTLFSVGNGTAEDARHNAFEIRQNGDIYITSGGTDIKLQDNIGKVETVTAITPSNSGSTDPIATKVVAENELTVSNALTDLDERKLDASAYTPTDLSNYYTKSETSGATELSNALSNKVDKVSGKGLSTNDYTTDEKNKLSGIASGAEVNQNTFSNIKVGSTTIAADSKTDTLEISGSGIVTITADATNDKITISASNAVTSVAGKTGAVTLGKSDVGLGNVDNTADANKTVKAATSAATADTAKAVALSGVTNADDLKAIEALTSTSGLLKKTAANTWTLDTNSYSTTAVAVTGATYNSTNKTIDLKNAAGTVVSTVDATAFIKDGMVSNVEVKNVASSGTCLVITFNTDAGKDAINIPISQIFDASNYYTTAQTSGATELQTAFNGKTDTATTTALNNVVTAHTANTSIHLTATEKGQLHTHTNKAYLDGITGTVGTMAYENASSYSSATQVNTALSNKVDKTEYATFSAATNTSIEDLNAAIDDFSGQSETVAAALNDLNNKKLDASAYTPSDYYTKDETSGATEIQTALSNKADKSAVDDFIDDLSGQSETVAAALNDLNTTITAHTADTIIHVTSNEKATWNTLQTQINAIQDFLKPRDYVEIGGVKWATMNVGASNVTDYGLYFQWGDISGYTADQVGSGEEKKYFGWADYKYGNGTSSPGATGMTKYNSTDGKRVLEVSDDAEKSAWLGWRMPTSSDVQSLIDNTNTGWTTSYNGSGVAGMTFTDKTDSSKVLFFPACGRCYDGSVQAKSSSGLYWSSSCSSSNVQNAYNLYFDGGGMRLQDGNGRYNGMPVRGVVG